MSSGSVAVKRTTLSLVLMEFWFAVGSGWETGPPPEKQGVTYLEKVQMLGWGLS
jgi:hypothetical protein